MSAEVETEGPPSEKQPKLKRKKTAEEKSFENDNEATEISPGDRETGENSDEIIKGPTFKSNVFVSDSLKNNLTGGITEFSLLSVFDSKGKKSSRRFDGSTTNYTKPNNFKSTFVWNQVDSGGTQQTWWKEPLFFTGADDKRLEEGLAFIRRKVNDENSEEFKNTRREMKTLVRKKMKRTDKRNDKSARFYTNKRKTPNHVIKKRNLKTLKS